MSYISFAQSQRYDRCLSLNSGTKRPARLHRRNALIEELLARIEMLAEFVERIVAVLADQQHRVDAEILAADAHRFVDRLKERNLKPLRNVAGHVVLRELIGVERHDIAAGIDQLAVEQVRLEEVFENVVGMRPKPQLGEDRGDFGLRLRARLRRAT